MFRVHASSLGDIMASPEKDGLSAGAMTFVENQVKQDLFDYKPSFSSKYCDKGNAVENDSIELYNLVNFTSHVKHVGRVNTDYMTCECDILASDRIVDIKSSWSKATFPISQKQAHDSGYEWQGRAYMLAYDRPLFELAYCLVSTPYELIGYEDESLHLVDDIHPMLRVFSLTYDRDSKKEEQIIKRIKACWAYYDEFKSEYLAGRLV